VIPIYRTYRNHVVSAQTFFHLMHDLCLGLTELVDANCLVRYA